MIDARGVDSDIVELLRNAAMAEKSVTHLLALMLLTHDPASENSFNSFTVMDYFWDAFDWDPGQMAALKVCSYFSANPWPDEVLNARYAPLLEAWRKNPSTYPIPDWNAGLPLNSAPLSDADYTQIMKCLEMG